MLKFSYVSTNIFTYIYSLEKIGHDIKSLLINLATLICFFAPIALYFLEGEERILLLKVAGGALAVATLAPPFGIYRPHPYSDWAHNKPWPRRE